jgi:exodeoxyribonuclease I
MPSTLLWHDYETSGVDPASDRPFQFAGIRTDENLNILGEAVSYYCEPSLDRLPHPQACLLTGLTPQFLAAKGVPEPEFIAHIHSQMSVPGTCSVGYNSVRFDDEVTRFTLYRNFYDPYEREWKNGNSRWDIIDMLRMARALRPSGITWPDHKDGAPSFRLEDIASINGLEHGKAHDAVSDVLATIEIARLVKNKQPRLYDYVYRHRSKQNVKALIDIERQQPFLHASSRLPQENGYLALMLPLCQHPTNNNVIIAVNLSADPDPLLEMDADQIRERLFTATKDLAEGEKRIALKGIHLNRCPVVATPRLIDAATAERLNIDLDRCRAHWQILRGHDLNKKIGEIFDYPSHTEIRDPELALYQGFLPDIDRRLLVKIRDAYPDQLGMLDVIFTDQRYNALLFRYRARHAYETLTTAERGVWTKLKTRWLTGEESGLLNIDSYNTELARLSGQSDLDGEKKAVLHALRQWGEKVTAEC